MYLRMIQWKHVRPSPRPKEAWNEAAAEDCLSVKFVFDYDIDAMFGYTEGFYARQHICYSAYMPRQFRLSVRPSHAYVVSKRLNLSSKLFHHLMGPSF